MSRMFKGSHFSVKDVRADLSGFYILFEFSEKGCQDARDAYAAFKDRDFESAPMDMGLQNAGHVGGNASLPMHG